MYKNKKMGQTLVEFAMLTPFVILVLAAILELSPLINAYVKLEKATHAAARTAAIYGSTDNEILDTFLINAYGMSFPEFYDGFNDATNEVNFPAYIIEVPDMQRPCTSLPDSDPPLGPDVKFDVSLGHQFPSNHCYSESVERFYYDPQRTRVRITPTRVSRINGSWVTVEVSYHYRVYTPVLFFFADLLFANETQPNTVKFVPINKFSTQRVE